MRTYAPKKIGSQQLIGHRGELLATERALSMSFVWQTQNRLETGIDGFMEVRDPVTHAMTAKWLGVQVKTTENGTYSRETDLGFDYLLDPADLGYWRDANVPVIIVLVRLADGSMFWQPVDVGDATEPRRLRFDKAADAFDRQSADRIAGLTIAKAQLGSHVPSMLTGEAVHLNMLRIQLPPTIFVGRSAFRSQREATREMMGQRGRHYFDWVVRERIFWSFRDPCNTALEEVVDTDSLERLETEAISLPDDPDDENTFIDLLRRSVEAQVREDLSFDKDSRTLYFRAHAPRAKRVYEYRSLAQMTSADVVSVYQKEGRQTVIRHHALSARYLRLGDDWFVSVSPTFVFTTNGYQTHRGASALLAGKKRFERNGSLRGQFLLWRHFLIASGAPMLDLLTDATALDPRPRIRFEALDPVEMERAVPEAAWTRSDPTASEHASTELLL